MKHKEKNNDLFEKKLQSCKNETSTANTRMRNVLNDQKNRKKQTVLQREVRKLKN